MTRQTVTFTDADGASLHTPWLTVLSGTGGSLTVQSGAGRLRSPGDAYAGTSATYGTGIVRDIDITTKITLHSPKSEEYPGIGYRMSGGTSGWDGFGNPVGGYQMWLEVATDKVGWIFAGGSPQYTAFAFTGGAAYWVRVKAVDASHKVAVWADGSPQGAWLIQQTDATFTAGYWGITQQAAVGNIDAFFDDLTWDDLVNAPALRYQSVR